MYKIIFSPEKKEISVDSETDLFHAATGAGIYISSGCAGEGNCGRCKIIIKKGKFHTLPSRFISEKEKKKGYVLACQTYARSDLEIEIPPETGLKKFQLVKEGIYTPVEEKVFPHSPLAKKVYLELPHPTLTDHLADWERVTREIRKKEKEIKDLRIDITKLRELANFVRVNNWRFTVSLDENGDIIDFEPGDRSADSYGIALDIGTTTVAIYLVDLNKGSLLGAKAMYNRQTTYGDDVITRIIYSEENADGLEKLTQAVRETVNQLISELAKEKNVSLEDILVLEVAGNPTMLHLFAGLEPKYIRKEPYLPTANFIPQVHAKEIGININPEAMVSFLPGVASYVGGDVTAGVLACGMNESPALSLLIDLGTNGEMVLGNKDFLISAACSAGPAFEGVGIKSGIRALEGAIERIQVSSDGSEVKYFSIGGTLPKGICGSGLVDSIAELFKGGFIDKRGKFVRESSSRIRETSEGLEFVIVPAKETFKGEDIVLGEPDIANLIRSKGAVFLGAEVLLEQMGYSFKDLKKIYIAGMFGTYLDIEKAKIIGLLPDLAKEKFVFMGNSAITGSKMCLLSGKAREKVKEIAQKMAYLELSVNPRFMNEYSSTLFLPHTNIDLFPSVKQMLKTQ